MFGFIEGCDKYSSLGITEYFVEVVEDGLFLWLKNNIIDGDKLWTTLDSPYFVFYDINED